MQELIHILIGLIYVRTICGCMEDTINLLITCHLTDPPFPILNIKHKPTHDCVKLPISAFVMCVFVCMSCVHCRMRLRCVNVAWEEGEALDTNATPPRVLITMYLPLTTLYYYYSDFGR